MAKARGRRVAVPGAGSGRLDCATRIGAVRSRSLTQLGVSQQLPPSASSAPRASAPASRAGAPTWSWTATRRVRAGGRWTGCALSVVVCGRAPADQRPRDGVVLTSSPSPLLRPSRAVGRQRPGAGRAHHRRASVRVGGSHPLWLSGLWKMRTTSPRRPPQPPRRTRAARRQRCCGAAAVAPEARLRGHACSAAAAGSPPRRSPMHRRRARPDLHLCSPGLLPPATAAGRCSTLTRAPGVLTRPTPRPPRHPPPHSSAPPAQTSGDGQALGRRACSPTGRPTG